MNKLEQLQLARQILQAVHASDRLADDAGAISRAATAVSAAILVHLQINPLDDGWERTICEAYSYVTKEESYVTS
jgi:hypothetical protein